MLTDLTKNSAANRLQPSQTLATQLKPRGSPTKENAIQQGMRQLHLGAATDFT